jgi:hypothetical protein
LVKDERLGELYEALAAGPYPPGCAGEEIDGVELVMLDADIAGVASHYLRNSRPITDDHRAMLIDLIADVDRVWARLPHDAAREFYRRARVLAEYLVTTR